ncbi:MAG TPA: hypothetical protein VFW87_12860, partial [Pirellulales bacterium]|nr:hypothetical protein [Pirellulales bacterium]
AAPLAVLRELAGRNKAGRNKARIIYAREVRRQRFAERGHGSCHFTLRVSQSNGTFAAVSTRTTSVRTFHTLISKLEKESFLPDATLRRGKLEDAETRGAIGFRAFKTIAGAYVREPLACLQGPAINDAMAGYGVRPAAAGDLDACNRVRRQVHGHDRGGELLDAIRQGAATVVEHNGRITGYAKTIGFFGHAVGESNRELQALVGAAPTFAGAGFLLPTRNTELFRWCLQPRSAGHAADEPHELRPVQ